MPSAETSLFTRFYDIQTIFHDKIMKKIIFIALALLLLPPGLVLGAEMKKGFYVNLTQHFDVARIGVNAIGKGGRLLAGFRIKAEGDPSKAYVWTAGEGFWNTSFPEGEYGSIRNISDNGEVFAGIIHPNEDGWYAIKGGITMRMDGEFWQDYPLDFFGVGMDLKDLQVSADGSRIAGSMRMAKAFVIDVKTGQHRSLPGTAYTMELLVNPKTGTYMPAPIMPGAKPPTWASGWNGNGKLEAMSRDGKRFLLRLDCPPPYPAAYIIDDEGKYLHKITFAGREVRQTLPKGLKIGEFTLAHNAHISGLDAFALSFDGRYAAGKVVLQYLDGVPLLGGHMPLTDKMVFPVRWDTQTGEILPLLSKPVEDARNFEMSDNGKVIAFQSDYHGKYLVWREGHGTSDMSQLLREYDIKVPVERTWDPLYSTLSYDGTCISTAFKQKNTDIYKDKLDLYLICFEGENHFEKKPE